MSYWDRDCKCGHDDRDHSDQTDECLVCDCTRFDLDTKLEAK